MKTAIPIVVLLLAASSLRTAEPGAKRAEALRANVKSFRLGLASRGAERGAENVPFYRLTLSVPPIKQPQDGRRRVQIDEDQVRDRN